jgi:hypothetical protein
MPRFLLFLVFAISSLALVAGEPELKWYKGNTHTHTILCGHADSAPEVVAGWYLEHGYNFLCLSEHNKFIDPASVELPKDRRADFILVPGQEVTGSVHTTALNVQRLVPFKFTSKKQFEVIQNHVDGTLDAKGVPILNHPNFKWAVKADDILQVKRLHLFELYNGHPTVYSEGDATHVSTEIIWDKLLSDGLAVCGVSSDDMHDLKKWGRKISNPGRGWVMVRSAQLTADAITQAMMRGDFYASSGVMLKTLSTDNGTFTIEADESATLKELESPVLTTNQRDTATEGFHIDFIGKEGKVLKTVSGPKAEFPLPQDQPYVRCKISFARKAAAGFDEVYAWTQPFYTDGRLKKIEEAEKAGR